MITIKKKQSCRVCRENFDEDSKERDYKLYSEYGFKTRIAFENHSSRNKNCPFKLINKNKNNDNNKNNIKKVKWQPYIKPITDDYFRL